MKTAELSQTPFATGSDPPGVWIASGPDPYVNTRQALAQLDLAPARGKRVLLKPNAGRIAPAGSGIVTEARVVAAAIDALQEAGATTAVGDSPIVGVKRLQALEASGIAAVARQRNAAVINLDARPRVDVGHRDDAQYQGRSRRRVQRGHLAWFVGRAHRALAAALCRRKSGHRPGCIYLGSYFWNGTTDSHRLTLINWISTR